MTGPSTMDHPQAGFTLIELIVTIVIIGILGVGISNFVVTSTQGMMDTAERQQLATIGWVVSEKVSREIREALPNSFTFNPGGNCLGFIPTVAATYYLSVPTSTAASSFEVVPFSNYESADVDSTQDRVAVYPNTSVGIYSLTTPLPPGGRIISGTVNQLTAGATLNAESIVLSAAHRFVTDSPNRKAYIVRNPVTYCFEGGILYRYSDYGFVATVPGFGFTRTIIGNRLNPSGSPYFRYSAGTLIRSAVVAISFRVVGDSGASQTIDQEVQVRNVP